MFAQLVLASGLVCFSVVWYLVTDMFNKYGNTPIQKQDEANQALDFTRALCPPVGSL
jgi:hypothetical protein